MQDVYDLLSHLILCYLVFAALGGAADWCEHKLFRLRLCQLNTLVQRLENVDAATREAVRGDALVALCRGQVLGEAFGSACRARAVPVTARCAESTWQG